MPTDKDRADAIIKESFTRYPKGTHGYEYDLAGYIKTIRQEAADTALKEAAEKLGEYGWQTSFRKSLNIPWNRKLSNREIELADACKLGWNLARAAILNTEVK